jgi:hypothetical protein
MHQHDRDHGRLLGDTVIGNFVAQAFVCLELDLWEHTAINGSLYRWTDITVGRENPGKDINKFCLR